MMYTDNPSHTRQVLVVGIISVLALISAGPRCALALDGRRLLEGGFDGGQLELLHWSHPGAPHHIPGLSFTERWQLSIKDSRSRAAALSGRMQFSEAMAPAPSPLEFVAPLYNIGFAYATEISIGTPPEKYSFLVDTGSDLVWLGCQGCDYCQPNPNPKYDPQESSTYYKMPCSDSSCLAVEVSCPKNKTCDFEYSYGSGYIYGVMSYETITLSTTSGTTAAAKDFAFGCGYELILDLGDVDGLLGLGRGNLSLTSQVGNLYGNKFSYCLVSTYDSNSSTSPLLFGDAAVPKAPVQYTPMVQNPNASYFGAATFYYIGLKGINVNGVPLDIPSGTFDIFPNGTGGVIVDSGTTLTLLTADAFNPLVTKMQSLITYKVANVNIGLLCYDLANVSSPTFPTVTMVFEGFDLELPQDNVFIRGLDENLPDSNSTLYCMGIAGSFGISIFGNFQQQNFQILYDRDAKQYGFAKVQCDKLSGY